MEQKRAALTRAGWWLAAAAALWALSFAAERRTRFELYSSGAELVWTVAGSAASAPVAIRRLDAVELHVMDSIEPPAGGFIAMADEHGPLLRDRLPWSFVLPRGELAPLGDWQLDEHAGAAVVYHRELSPVGPFSVSGCLRGRFLHAATLSLLGDPTLHLQLRRGLINSDLFILDADGATLAATSIDPQPWADLAAAASTWLRGAALACLLLAAFPLLGRAAAAAVPALAVRWWRPPAAGLQWTLTITLAVAASATSAWVARDILGGLPHEPDGVANLVQASWLARGRLSLPAPPLAAHFDLPYIHNVNDRLIGHYPPGWPAVLALGVAAGLPWLVAPLLRGVLTVLLFLLGRELASPAVGLAAALLAGLSPLATLLFASHLSHGAAATALVAFLLLLLHALRRRSAALAAAAGACAGAAFAVRPLTAIAFSAVGAVLLAVELAERGDRATYRLTAATAAAGLLAAIPTLAVNNALTGNPFSFSYSLARGSMYGTAKIPFGLANLDAIVASTPPALCGWGWPWLDGRLALALPLALVLVPLLRRRPERSDLVLAGVYMAVAAAFVGARASGLHGFGPRYHFEAFAALQLLAARGFARLARGEATDGAAPTAAPWLAAGLFVALNLTAAVALPDRLQLYRGYNRVDGCLVEELDSRGIDRALVLFSERDWRNWAEAAPRLDPLLDGDLVFATAGDDPAELRAAYNDRQVLVWDGEALYGLSELRRR